MMALDAQTVSVSIIYKIFVATMFSIIGFAIGKSRLLDNDLN